MALTCPNQSVVDKVRAEFGLDEQGIKEAVKILRDWLELQPHLPHNCEDGRLERWLIRCKNSLERAKASIDMYYTLKNVIPELMMEWDVFSEWYRKCTAVGYVIPLPQLTEDNCRVTVIALTDYDPDKANFVHIFKAMVLFYEIRMCEDYNSSDIVILDLDGLTITHVAKLTIPLLKKIEVCTMRAMVLRVKQMHFINVPSYAETVVKIFKSLMKPKVAARIHVYPKGAINLKEMIPSEVLPFEYGGEAGTISDLWSAWLRKVEGYRDWFLEQDNYKADESKRPGKAFDSGEIFGFDGTFRKLNVD